MPARIQLSDDEITAALRDSAGLQSVAAAGLGISTRTLSRRLKANPDLWPSLPIDPVWERALCGDEAIRSGSDVRMRGSDPFTRYVNLIDFVDAEHEDEPRRLTEPEIKNVIQCMLDIGFVKVNARPGSRKR